jgi:NAD+ synthase (glutamine-hydrolysing)
MRFALAQLNPTVGDIGGNVAKILAAIDRARAEGARVVVFPELAITGYPPKDLLLKPSFIDDNLAALEEVAKKTVGIAAIVGYADRNSGPVGRPLHNAVAVCEGGRVASRHFKTLLPTYDVFDESRYFEPGPIELRNQIVVIDGVKVGISICEDLWNDERFISRRLYHQNPIADLGAAGAQVLVNCSASPFVLDKHDFRLKLFGGQAARFNVPIVYANQVGGNDELVFDGCSVAFDARGNVIAQAKGFGEDLVCVDVQLPGERDEETSKARDEETKRRGDEDVQTTSSLVSPVSPSLIPIGLDSLYHALLLGLSDYVNKCGFKSVVLGLSGGIDSALVGTLAAHALGPDRVVGVAMPSRFSSDHSVNDARDLAKNLGIEFHVVPIKDVHDQYESLLLPFWGDRGRDVTEENLQARIRGAILMAFSNKYNHLLLTTGNKSEVAVGYCTLYGDMCGGLAVISDVPKTMVWDLSRWINAKFEREVIPVSSIEKVPSAELRPNQTDQDSLPPYDVLDGIIERYVEDEEGYEQIVAAGFDAATVARVIKLIDRSEYKRRQAAPGLKVTSRAFGFGRRMPIAQNYRSWE